MASRKHKRTAYALMISGRRSGPLHIDRVYRSYAEARRDYDAMQSDSPKKGVTPSGGRIRLKTVRIDADDWERLSNPQSMLFRTRAAALKYAREHGAKRFSIRKVKAGR